MKRYWPVLALLVVLFGWWGFSRGEAPVTLHFSGAHRATIVSLVSTNGKVEPVEWAAARAESAGIVRRVLVERGQPVKAGQELVALDTTAAHSELETALAKRREAQAEAATVQQGGKAQTVADLNDSLASAQAALSVAQRNLEATLRLFDKQAATKLQVQDAQDAVERAKLHITALNDQKQTLVTAAEKTVADARMRDAQSGVNLAQHKLQIARIAAPIAGTLYQFDLKVGAYLQPGDLAGLVGKLDQVKVVVYVDEPDLGRVALDMPVTLTWDAKPGQKWTGRVNKLPSEVIALGTRTVGEVTTIVDNPNHDLLPGVSVNVSIVSKTVTDALSVPRPALHTFKGATGVYKLTDKTITWTPVTTGISDLNNVQILTGISESDQVVDRVVEPADAELRNGLRVKVATTD